MRDISKTKGGEKAQVIEKLRTLTNQRESLKEQRDTDSQQLAQEYVELMDNFELVKSTLSVELNLNLPAIEANHGEKSVAKNGSKKRNH